MPRREFLPHEARPCRGRGWLVGLGVWAVIGSSAWAGRWGMAFLLAGIFLAWSTAGAAEGKPGAEVREAQDWATAAFDKPGTIPPLGEGLHIEQNRNLILKNRTWTNAPLRLGDKTYRHGLYMDTPATLRVSLLQPATEFSAEVGIDRYTSGGSARFHVWVAGQKVFSTPVVKSGDPILPVRVALPDVREFSLEVDDAGDGINCDQCDWGDAAVRFADGTPLFLDELPLYQPPALRNWNVPFSFRYDGRPSAEFLAQWEYNRRPETGPAGPRQVVSYRDPQTGLVIEATVQTYPDAAAVDWVCRLTNTGTADTGLIEDFLPLDLPDLLGTPAPPGAVTLRWSRGDRYQDNQPGPESFLPYDEVLPGDQPRPFLGLASFQYLPFFNVQAPGGGWIVAIGWIGRWQAEFRLASQGRLNVRAGMQKTHFRLKPGETVRTPRIVLFRWHGEEMIQGHNQFRRLMLKHYTPQQAGHPALPPIGHNCAATVYVRNMELPNEENQLALIRRISDLGCDTYWMDAYWYPQPWHLNVGSWFPRPEDFPRGLCPLSDAAHAKGMKFVLWLLPPSVAPGTQWAQEHPEFLHGGKGGQGGLWKMGDPQARQFLTDWLCDRLQEWKVDIYREDGSGMPPEEGPEDRQGIAEMHHVAGHYQFWWDILKRNPGLLMDNCNGGGNRLDIETSAQAFFLWRSDLNDIGEGLKGEGYWPLMARADQVMGAGLSLYGVLHTGPVWDMHPYSFRSAMAAGICLYGDVDRPGFPDDLARQGIAELKQLQPLFLGDFYPLVELTPHQRDWFAYQLDRPDLGEGCAFFFRRPESNILMMDITLRGLEEDALYRVSWTGETYQPGPWKEIRGRELRKPEVLIREKPGSALLRYQRLSPTQ